MSMMDKVLRAQIEERGFEALQRLYITACSDTGQSRKVASLLLGLYNGDRFPFDLTDLRGLDDALFEDCMAVLRMDGRICRLEVHNYFEKGSTKFERLASEWRMTDHRLMRLGHGHRRSVGILWTWTALLTGKDGISCVLGVGDGIDPSSDQGDAFDFG